jgi:hypothetical protein
MQQTALIGAETGGMAPRPWWPLVAIVIVLLGLWPTRSVTPLTEFDQDFYIGIASDLLTEGRFTNGFSFQTTPNEQTRPSDMRFTPLYPSLLAATALVDPAFRQAMNCIAATHGESAACSRRAPVIRTLQFAMLCVMYWLIWGIALMLSRDRRVAWAALIVALITAPDMLGYVNWAMTEITAQFLITATTAAAVRGLTRPEEATRWLSISGVLFGLSTLTRPAFFEMFLLCAAGLMVLGIRQTYRRQWRAWLGFVIGGLLPILPWILRNWVMFDAPSLTMGYGAHVLNERVAFDLMTPFEWRLSFLCWLPDGNGMGDLLFGHGACHRFQWSDYPDSFYSIGNHALMDQSLAASGGWPHMFPYLMHTYILPHFLWHMATTLPLAFRGAMISKYWGLILAPICLVQTIRAAWRGDVPFLAISLPAWAMLGFAAAISVNQPRYNLMLITPFAVAAGMLLAAWPIPSRSK